MPPPPQFFLCLLIFIFSSLLISSFFLFLLQFPLSSFSLFQGEKKMCHFQFRIHLLHIWWVSVCVDSSIQGSIDCLVARARQGSRWWVMDIKGRWWHHYQHHFQYYTQCPLTVSPLHSLSNVLSHQSVHHLLCIVSTQYSQHILSFYYLFVFYLCLL